MRMKELYPLVWILVGPLPLLMDGCRVGEGRSCIRDTGALLFGLDVKGRGREVVLAPCGFSKIMANITHTMWFPVCSRRVPCRCAFTFTSCICLLRERDYPSSLAAMKNSLWSCSFKVIRDKAHFIGYFFLFLDPVLKNETRNVEECS